MRHSVTHVLEPAFMLMGYDQGVFSSVVSNKDFLTIIGNPDDAQLGIIVASYNLGCLAGSIFAIFFCERLGRRWSIWVAMAWIIVRCVPLSLIFRAVRTIEIGLKLTSITGWGRPPVYSV